MILRYKLFLETKKFGSNKDNKISKIQFSKYLSNLGYSIHPDIIKNVLSWNEIYRSPQSIKSFYSKPKRTGKTEDGTLRLSDHWNYTGVDGQFHSKTDISVTNTTYWTLAKFDGSKNTYEVISSYPVDYYRNEIKSLINTELKDDQQDIIDHRIKISLLIKSWLDKNLISLSIDDKKYYLDKLFRLKNVENNKDISSMRHEFDNNRLKVCLDLDGEKMLLTKSELIEKSKELSTN